LLTQFAAEGLPRNRLEELMQLLTQRLSLLFEFAPPDFYERSTFASYIDTLIENGLVDEAADGALRLHAQARAWEKHVERLLPADAVIAIRRVAGQES
jgi:glycerol-3-phosphate O-acyltransferase